MQAAVALQSLQLDPTEEDPEVALSLSLPLSPAACAPAAESTAVTLHAESRAVAPSCAAAELLLREWQAGTKTAATRFYYLYKDRVYRWARIKARDHHLAEDLCQEVWRRIHRSVLTYRAGTSPNAWVYRILINTHRSLWRRGQRFFASLLPGLSGEEVSEGPPGTVTQAGSSPEALFTRKQELEVILKAMHEDSRAVPQSRLPALRGGPAHRRGRDHPGRHRWHREITSEPRHRKAARATRPPRPVAAGSRTMNQRKNMQQEESFMRPGFVNGAMRSAVRGRPEDRALAGWLNELGQLSSPVELDRAILDRVHQELPKSSRRRPVLLLAVCLCCVVFGATAKLRPHANAPGSRLAKPTLVEEREFAPAECSAAGRVSLQTENVDSRESVLRQATVNLPFLASVSTLRSAHTKRKPALGSPRYAIRQRSASAAEEAPSLRLAAFTARTIPSSMTAILPIELPVSGADPEVIPRPSALEFSPASLAVAPIRPLDRLHGMVSPAGLVDVVAERSDSSRRPLYKRAWFVSMLAIAATGVAAGVTAAVVTSHQAPTEPSPAGHPITIALGPS